MRRATRLLLGIAAALRLLAASFVFMYITMD